MNFKVWHHQSLNSSDYAHRRTMRIEHSLHGCFLSVECFWVVAFVASRDRPDPWVHHSLN